MAEKDNPLDYPTLPSLVGKKIYLKIMEPDENEFTYLWFLHSDPQSQTCHQPLIVTPKDYVEARKKKEKTINDGDFLAITKEENQPVAKLRYFNLNMSNRSAELGYIACPEYRQKGYTKEGLVLLVRYLFGYMGLNKVYAQTASFNTASVHLLQSLGFRLDGTLRQHHFYRGTLHDDLIYSLLKFECGFLNE
jgi:[ribosomal protein S5]-alanine N-acetyltransferase